MTFGVFSLLVSMGERHFIRSMSPQGVITRGGKHIAWNEFTGVTHTRGTMEGVVLSNEYILKSPRGKVSLPTWRTENAQEARDYMLKYLPSQLLK
jgi:hypothetical protein